ncbi:DNA polymerase III subunit beta [Candidatus Gottesmanbacteria bacterium]|nr:DNA polymerase III subunit beta [Candidatus Gottesmanbacteria bacterium]
MRVTILKENLYKALSIASRNISLRPQLPVLNNILLKTEGDGLILSSATMELGIVVKAGAKIEEEGETTVAGRLFTEYISQLPSEKLTLSFDKDVLTAKTQSASGSFTTLPAKDFPSFPVSGKNETVSIPLLAFQNGVIRTAFAASTDDGRPVLTGIRILASNKGIGFYATDGYRLSIEQIKTEKEVGGLDFIFPARILVEILKIAQEEQVKDILFTSLGEKKQVIFSLGKVTVVTRLIEGDFPNIEKIIPTTFKTKVTVEAEKFLSSVKMCSLFARGSSNIVKIKIQKNGLRLSANTPQVGENVDEMDAAVEGEEMEIAFNYRFLLDLLNNFPDKEVLLESSGPLNPGVFKPASGKENFLHIIMPVRLQG